MKKIALSVEILSFCKKSNFLLSDENLESKYQDFVYETLSKLKILINSLEKDMGNVELEYFIFPLISYIDEIFEDISNKFCLENPPVLPFQNYFFNQFNGGEHSFEIIEKILESNREFPKEIYYINYIILDNGFLGKYSQSSDFEYLKVKDKMYNYILDNFCKIDNEFILNDNINNSSQESTSYFKSLNAFRDGTLFLGAITTILYLGVVL